jgi:hypothetical protein
MALIKCKKCGLKARVGFMPTASCGMVGLLGISAGLACCVIVFMYLLHDSSLLLRVPLGIISFIVGFMAVEYIPLMAEWLIAFFHRCPQCGSRNWSFPFTEGFGL